jgi:hypothetical protein
MKKILFIATCLFLLSCSSENEDDEWIQPRQCIELAIQNPRCDSDPNCQRDKAETIEKTISMLEEYECVMRKTACIDDNVKDDDVKCKREKD